MGFTVVHLGGGVATLCGSSCRPSCRIAVLIPVPKCRGPSHGCGRYLYLGQPDSGSITYFPSFTLSPL